jgi:hypothetical protein
MEVVAGRVLLVLVGNASGDTRTGSMPLKRCVRPHLRPYSHLVALLKCEVL